MIIPINEYCSKIGMPLEKLKSKSRKREVITARFIYWYHLRENRYTYEEIGRMFGMNHATVIHAVRTVDNFIAIDDSYIEKFLKAIQNHKLQ